MIRSANHLLLTLGRMLKRMITPCKKEGNVLFNDALNTFYLRLYGVGRMLKDHSDSEGRNPLPPYGLFFAISSKGTIYMFHPSYRIAHTNGLCYTSRGTLTGTRNTSMGPPHEGSIRRPIAPCANALTTELHLATDHSGNQSHLRKTSG